MSFEIVAYFAPESLAYFSPELVAYFVRNNHIPQKKEKKNWKQVCREHLNYNPDICPVCGKGNMITIEIMLPARAPPETYVLLKHHQPK